MPTIELVASGRALAGQLATVDKNGRAAVRRRTDEDVLAVFRRRTNRGRRCELELTYPGQVTEMRAGGSIMAADWVRPNRYGCVVVADRRRRVPVGAAMLPRDFGLALSTVRRGELVPVMRVDSQGPGLTRRKTP